MTLQTVVLGADPAGLTAAYELTRFGTSAITVLEPSGHIGGLAHTESYHGYQIDLGGGALSCQTKSVRKLWESLLPEGSVEIKVRSHIHYRHRLFKHPLSFTNAVKHLGPIDTGLASISYLANWLTRQQQQTTEIETETAEANTTETDSAEAWITRRFGAHVGRLFFQPYLENVWGRPCVQLSASCAQQAFHNRKSNNLLHAAIEALVGNQDANVHYPQGGGASRPWKNCAAQIKQAGHRIARNAQIIQIEHSGHKIQTVIATDGHQLFRCSVDHMVSSLPLPQLVKLLRAPSAVIKVVNQLKHRHSLQVALIVNQAELFSEHWIYVHHPDVCVSRIQNFKNWDAGMVPDADKTCLGMTYFCDESDGLWQQSETELIEQAKRELVELGIIFDAAQIAAGTVLKQPQAYPVSTVETIKHWAVVQDFLDQFENLQTIGRNGLHQYWGLDQCILSGQQAAEAILRASSPQQQNAHETPQALHSPSNQA